LIDQNGYLLTHPSYQQLGGTDALWIGEREPKLALRLISDGVFYPQIVRDFGSNSDCTYYRINDTTSFVHTDYSCGTYWFSKIPGNTSNAYLVGYDGSTCTGIANIVIPICTPITVDLCNPTIYPRRVLDCPDLVLTKAQIETIRGNSTCSSSITSTTTSFSSITPQPLDLIASVILAIIIGFVVLIIIVVLILCRVRIVVACQRCHKG